MFEISFGSLIDVLIIILLVQKMQAQVPQPSCKYYKEEIPPVAFVDCQITKGEDNCLSSSKYLPYNIDVTNNFTYVTENNSEHEFVNAIIYRSWGQTTGIILLEEKVGTCWNVQVTGGEFPYQIFVNNIPVSRSFDFIAANAYMAHHLHHCNSSQNVCSQLNNTNLSFNAIPTMNQLHLSIKVKVDALYKVELWSGDCNISCEGDQSKCNVNTVYDKVLNLTSKETEVINFINITHSKYYCARIESDDNCCAIYTETRKIDDIPKLHAHVVDVSSLDIVIVIAIIVIILAALIIICIMHHKVCSIIRSLRSPIIQPTNEGSNSQEPESEIIKIIGEMKESTQVFLVYPHDREDLLDLISSFRRLLQVFVQKVWDPFFFEDIDFFAENIPLRVEDSLSNPDVRIVVIETEMAVAVMTEKHRQEMPNQNNHFLNKVFLYTMDRIKRDITLDSNYTRLFVVRLNPDMEGRLEIALNTRYEMPDQFEQLIQDMSRSISRSVNLEDFRCLLCEEKRDFIQRLNIIYK